MARNTFQDDDGRTIADMSQIPTRRPFAFSRVEDNPRKTRNSDRESASRPWESDISSDARKGLTWGAISAALLIALAFIVGLGLVILLIMWIGS